MMDQFEKAMAFAAGIHDELLNEQKEASSELQRELDDVTDERDELRQECTNLRSDIRELESKETGD